jgi:hypothetical protein
MKATLAITVGLFLSLAGIAQQRVVTPKPTIQQLQKIKIVPVAVKDESDMISQMNGLEIQMNAIQTRQQQLQSDLDALAKAQQELKKKMDGMSEMSETTALRLQMMMDRRSKFMSMLSNMLKKMSDTQNTIVQNLK